MSPSTNHVALDQSGSWVLTCSLTAWGVTQKSHCQEHRHQTMAADSTLFILRGIYRYRMPTTIPLVLAPDLDVNMFIINPKPTRQLFILGRVIPVLPPFKKTLPFPPAGERLPNVWGRVQKGCKMWFLRVRIRSEWVLLSSEQRPQAEQTPI